MVAGKVARREDIQFHGMSELIVSDVEFKDLPLFKLEKLAVATNNFHNSNKLGQGGFGPVFKVIDCSAACSNQTSNQLWLCSLRVNDVHKRLLLNDSMED